MPAPQLAPARPAHRSPALVGCVATGGALGTLLRATAGQAAPAVAGSFPWATFAVNMTGAFALGLLLHLLALTGRDEGWRRVLRVTVGTGVLGGYTTYSAFAVEAVVLAEAGRIATATAYVVGSVVGGALAAWIGAVCAGALAGRARQVWP